MAVPARKDDHFTYGDYLEWPQDERWELIEGVPFDMSPAPSRDHQRILMRLAAKIQNFLLEKGDKCHIYPAPFDVRLPTADEKDDDVMTVVQPDITVICDESKLDERGCRGTPDFVVEIVSPSTVKRDMTEKLLLYERHGVPEYWIIHPGEKSVMVYRLNESKKYLRPEIFEYEDTIEIALKDTFRFNLKEIF